MILIPKRRRAILPAMLAPAGDAAQILDWFRTVCAAQGQPVRTAEIAITAYVNEGRWVADCLCGAGVAVDPDEGFAYCLAAECGRWYAVGQIVLPKPAAVAALDAVLSERRRLNQQWRPGETIERLQAENDVFGGAVQ